MSQAEQSDPDLPEQVAVNMTRSDQIEKWHKTRKEVAKARDCAPEDLARTDVLDALMEVYEFHRLGNDERIESAKEHVADDHCVYPSDVSLSCLLKITCSAYNGWQMTDDWDITKNNQ